MVRYKVELSHGEVEFTAEIREFRRALLRAEAEGSDRLAWAEHVKAPEEGARPSR
ncbi:hypothetical protein [Thermus tengchongensis]|uniref:hypothetical protein n=1 Tax=Thermus tengchongensis TaxID=1214928 RepID=UPI0019804631|nr:hypothetical protein [Thermus tengchongensis]